MADETKRYTPMNDEDEPIELNDLLEPYAPAQDGYAPLGQNGYAGQGGNPYQQEDYDSQSPYGDHPYVDSSYENGDYSDEGYSDYHEELDHEGRLRTAMGVFNSVSTLVGVVVILLLVGMLISLVSWLKSDIIHSLILLQSGIG